jgi:hypothetical protein
MRGGSCNGGCGDDRGLGEARAGVNGGGVVTNSLLALLVLAKDVIEKMQHTGTLVWAMTLAATKDMRKDEKRILDEQVG